jgi:hypothetical protein
MLRVERLQLFLITTVRGKRGGFTLLQVTALLRPLLLKIRFAFCWSVGVVRQHALLVTMRKVSQAAEAALAVF